MKGVIIQMETDALNINKIHAESTRSIIHLRLQEYDIFFTNDSYRKGNVRCLVFEFITNVRFVLGFSFMRFSEYIQRRYRVSIQSLLLVRYLSMSSVTVHRVKGVYIFPFPLDICFQRQDSEQVNAQMQRFLLFLSYFKIIISIFCQALI